MQSLCWRTGWHCCGSDFSGPRARRTGPKQAPIRPQTWPLLPISWIRSSIERGGKKPQKTPDFLSRGEKTAGINKRVKIVKPRIRSRSILSFFSEFKASSLVKKGYLNIEQVSHDYVPLQVLQRKLSLEWIRDQYEKKSCDEPWQRHWDNEITEISSDQEKTSTCHETWLNAYLPTLICISTLPSLSLNVEVSATHFCFSKVLVRVCFL